jgi:elongation factor Ts
MAFTAQDVNRLRQQTGVGMMDCKKALTEAEGDFERAVALLREKGLAAAAKKADRVAAEGVVYAMSDNDAKIGVIVEVNSETDFVAKNDMFNEFVTSVAGAIEAHNPADVDALLGCKLDSGETVEEALRDKILTIGENLKIRRFTRYEGITASYIHGGGRIAVLTLFDTDLAQSADFETYAKDVCMQIAAANPLYLNREAVPAEVIAKEREILMAQAINEGKPANIAEKMVNGRIAKYYKDNCLLDQAFVKDGDITVAQYTDKVAKELGGSIKVVNFVRYEKGEGLEKREDNFADEVANMIK